MKNTLLLFILMLCAVPILAQDSTALSTKANAWIDKPDVVIKGEELKNFPSSQLLEMLIGRIPGLDFSLRGDTRFLYVVDGLIWQDINAININDVEEIAFYRGGLTGKFGVNNAPAGVILITTKSAALKQPISVNVNALAGVGSVNYNFDKKHVYPQSYHVAISEGYDKFSWRTAATYSKNLSGYGAADRDNKLQLSGDLRIEPLKWISIGAGLNYAPASFKATYMDYRNPSMGESTNKNTLDNWNGFFTVKAQPIKGLVNEFRIRYSHLKLDQDAGFASYQSYPGNLPYFGMDRETIIDKEDRFSLLNNLNYTFSADQGRIKFKASAIFQYNLNKYKTESEQFYNLPAGSEQKSWFSHHTYTRSPDQNLIAEGSVDLYDILSIQGGVSRDTFSDITSRAYYSPYLAANLNLKNVLLKDTDVINELSLVTSYSRYRALVPATYDHEGGSGSMLTFNDFHGEENDKMKMQTYGLKTSFFNNRLHLSGDWLKEDTYSYALRIYYDYNFVHYQPFAMTSKKTGWRVWASADILRNTSFKWNAGLNMYKSKNDLDFIDNKLTSFYLNEYSNNSGTQFGMQQRFSYEGFSLNVNGYAVAKKPWVGTNEKHSYFNLNYATLGYDFKGKQALAGFKDLNVSVFGRNLIQHNKEYNFMDTYRRVGLAVNARF